MPAPKTPWKKVAARGGVMGAKIETDLARANARIKDLEYELDETRCLILSLMDDEIRELLKSYRQCGSRSESKLWRDSIINELIAIAAKHSTEVDYLGRQRALCPLCGHGANSPYCTGFLLPEGMTRHLTGDKGAYLCDVMDIAVKLARNYWNNKFANQDEIDRKEKEALLLARRKNEINYIVSPYEKMKLIDESFLITPRESSEMKFAEDRLIHLGLEKIIDDNAVAWVDDRDAFIIYADPRECRSITFTGWMKPLPKKESKKKKFYFSISDRTVKNIKNKYEELVTAEVGKIKK